MTRLSRFAWLAALIVQEALPSFGEDAPPAPPAPQAANPADEYDLQRCVDVALSRNPSIRAAAASVAVAMADLKQAKGLNDPKLTAAGGV
ncbi:MAG TPA: TolC family protein [Armatimonadota bacterium]|nr:TolC family protein [Armatimonadota bacterium]